MADKLSATPRNSLLGMLADTAKASYSPQRTQQMQGLMQFFGAPDVAATLDRLSYGEPLTTGKGFTTQMRPETVGALMAAIGVMPSLKGVEVGAATVGRAIAPTVERFGMRQVEAGTPIGRALVDLTQGSRSSMIDPAMARVGIPETKAVDAAGNPVRLYRGGDSEREPLTFGLNEGIGKTKGAGITLSSSPDVAATYATGRGNVAPAYVDLKNPIVIDAKGKSWNELGEGGNNTTDQFARYAQSQGHDGIIFKNLVDQGPAGRYVSDMSSEPSDVYTVFNQANVRSAISDEGLLNILKRNEVPIPKGGLLDVAAPDVAETLIYHGTTPKSAKAIEKSGFDVAKSADGTIWFTSNPNIGEVAATGKGAVVKRAFDEKNLKLAGWDDIDKYSVDELINKGYDGVKMPDANQTVYQIFNPEKLRAK